MAFQDRTLHSRCYLSRIRKISPRTGFPGAFRGRDRANPAKAAAAAGKRMHTLDLDPEAAPVVQGMWAPTRQPETWPGSAREDGASRWPVVATHTET
jgi:hypothetical protein